MSRIASRLPTPGRGSPTLFALFPTLAAGEAAVNELAGAGFVADEIGFLSPGDVREPRAGRKQVVGIGAGSALGGVAGAVLGAAAVGAIPGIGPVLVAGALVPVVIGAVTGVGGGAALGSLLAANVTEDQGLYYQQEVESGRTLVSVTSERVEEAWSALERAGALEVARVGPGQTARRLIDED
jgi:hypothetical protein